MGTNESEKEQGLLSTLLGWVVYLLVIVILTYVIITFVGQRTVVSGSSMETTLSDGDNRNHSSDSRDPSVGVLTREDLIGKAWVRVYPFDEMGVIKHE